MAPPNLPRTNPQSGTINVHSPRIAPAHRNKVEITPMRTPIFSPRFMVKTSLKCWSLPSICSRQNKSQRHTPAVGKKLDSGSPEKQIAIRAPLRNASGDQPVDGSATASAGHRVGEPVRIRSGIRSFWIRFSKVSRFTTRSAFPSFTNTTAGRTIRL